MLAALALAFAPFASAQDVRLPAAEVWSVRSAEALSTLSFSLADVGLDELARPLFGASLDYDAIRVVYFPARIDDDFSSTGNVIRLPLGRKLSKRTLMHELTHVWQFQTAGTGYISDCVLSRKAAWLSEGDERAAYEYELVEGRSLRAYPAEQQAEIVEALWAGELRASKEEQARLRAELQAGSPVFSADLAYDEYAAGLAPRGWALLEPERPALEPRGLALVEFRF